MLRLIFSLFIFISINAQAQTVDVDRVVRVYDGDTITVDIAQWPAIVGESISVRIRGIDTPEIRGKCEEEKIKARQARDYVADLLSDAEQVQLTNIERGKYFRLIADVLIDDQDLATQVLQQQLARPYEGGKRQPWCDANH